MEFNFSQLSLLLDSMVFLITLFITYMGFRLYRLFRKPRYLQFSLGFLLINIGYLFIVIINLLTYPSIHTTGVEKLQFSGLLTTFWFIPILAGLLILAYLYYEINDLRLQLLLASLIIAGFLLGGADEFSFFILSGILFLFIALRLYQHYRASPNQGSLLILLGFSLLFLAKLSSGFLLVHGSSYVVYYLFKLAGVALIAYSLRVIAR